VYRMGSHLITNPLDLSCQYPMDYITPNLHPYLTPSSITFQPQLQSQLQLQLQSQLQPQLQSQLQQQLQPQLQPSQLPQSQLPTHIPPQMPQLPPIPKHFPPQQQPELPPNEINGTNDMVNFLKHKRDKKGFCYHAIACSDYLNPAFSGLCKMRDGEYTIHFHTFFYYFNMYRYICCCKPIKYESVQELFRESKSDWKKKSTPDGNFLVTLRDPKQIPTENPRNNKILDKLRELQEMESKKNDLLHRINEALLKEMKTKKEKTNSEKKKRVSKPKRTSSSRQKPPQVNNSLPSNVYVVREPAMSPETYVPNMQRKRRLEEREVQPTKYHCTEKQASFY